MKDVDSMAKDVATAKSRILLEQFVILITFHFRMWYKIPFKASQFEGEDKHSEHFVMSFETSSGANLGLRVEQVFTEALVRSQAAIRTLSPSHHAPLHRRRSR